MATSNSIIRTYETQDLTVEVPFRKDGFFNATAVAKAFGKDVYEWLRLPSTEEYITQLVDFTQSRENPGFEKNQLVIVKKGAPDTGGGTWLHPKLAVPFARWLNAAFAVWCDAQIDAIIRGEAPESVPRVSDLRALLYAARALNVAPSGQLSMAHKYFDQFKTTRGLLPGYAIDAPIIAGVSGDSAEVTSAAKHLLPEYGQPCSIYKFNEIMEEHGFLENKTRPSSKEPGATRKFWNVTDKGLEYGKNVINPNNPRSTQPHWYRSKFAELLNVVGLIGETANA